MAKQPETSSGPDLPRKRGRPPKGGETAEDSLQIRCTTQQRAPWQQSAKAWQLKESEWARRGLDAWVRVCDCAAKLGVSPAELVDVALSDHQRVRTAIAELARASVRGSRSGG